jgi:hypothetical protein
MIASRMVDARKTPVSRLDARTASDMRTKLVKDLMASESAAADAKTARLKALRLAREAEEKTVREAAPLPPSKPRKRSIRAS